MLIVVTRCSSLSANRSSPVDQKAKRSRDRRGLGIRLSGRRRRRWAKVGRVNEDAVRLVIKRRVARAEFSFYGFDDAESVRRVFVKNVQCPFTRCGKEQTRFRLINIGIDAGADRTCLNHYCQSQHP